MKVAHYIQSAENDLYEARHDLDGGYSLFRVLDNLNAALHWAMEAWLTAKGHKPIVQRYPLPKPKEPEWGKSLISPTALKLNTLLEKAD